MPSGDQHIQQATHNIGFLTSFYKVYLYNDWSVTVGFYAALHILENVIFVKKQLKYRGDQIVIEHTDDLPVYASRQSIPAPQNLSSTPVSPHQFRNIIIQENFPEVAEFYMLLYRESKNSRYKKYKFTDNEVAMLVKYPLSRITDWSNKQYSTAYKLDLN